jgi:hypothetical protein
MCGGKAERLIASRLSNKTSRKRVPVKKPRVDLAGTRQETFTRGLDVEVHRTFASQFSK